MTERGTDVAPDLGVERVPDAPADSPVEPAPPADATDDAARGPGVGDLL